MPQLELTPSELTTAIDKAIQVEVSKLEAFKARDTKTITLSEVNANKHLFLIRSVTSETLAELTSPDEVIQEMLIFKEKVANLLNPIALSVKIKKQYLDLDTNDIEGGYALATYYVIKSSLPEYYITTLTQITVAELLNPSTTEDYTVPECSLVSLFIDGTINWATLQSLTYKKL